ncbi:hypothetical protein AB0E08_08475 [Streptomyces sp. NPDC048281]|uniref:hypothetical protein n=1 Tax=Streptomyces sp. NPDC048281 TaxID=3154715 RepID=UPI003426C6C5
MAAPKNRSARLNRIVNELNTKYALDWASGERVSADYDDARREWSYGWTDGPTVEQVRRAARKADREVTEGLLYRRELSQKTVALGAIRLAVAPTARRDFRDRPSVTPSDVEELWRTVSKPRPRDDREQAMAAAIVAEANGDRGLNWASVYDLCRTVQEKGLAVFLRRAGVELTPIERLTDRYASSPASLAWSHQLTPLTALEAFSAVQADTEAKPQAVTDALTLLPDLHAALDEAAAELQARLQDETAA